MNSDWENLYGQGITIADDGTITHHALDGIRNIRNQSITTLNDAAPPVAHRLGRELAEKVFALLMKKTLYEIWDIMSQLEPDPESTLCPEERCWRKNDLAMDIQDLYADIIPMCLTIIEDFKTYRRILVVVKFVNYVEFVLKNMVDLEQRLSILMNLIKPTSENLLTTQTINVVNQFMLIRTSAMAVKGSFELKCAVKKDLDCFARLNRRMYVFLDEANLTKLSISYSARYDYIKAVTEANEEGHENFRRIVCDVETLNDEIAEYSTMCRCKCERFNSLFDRAVTYGQSHDNYTRRKIRKFISDVYDFFCEIFEAYEQFYHRFLIIKQRMFVDGLLLDD